MDTEPQRERTREDQPLLRAPDEASWRPPCGFVLIELAIMANVFLYGLDSTITAATYGVISSEFNSANTASWLTTSYLVTRASLGLICHCPQEQLLTFMQYVFSYATNARLFRCSTTFYDVSLWATVKRL